MNSQTNVLDNYIASKAQKFLAVIYWALQHMYLSIVIYSWDHI